MRPLVTTVTTPASDRKLITLADLREQLRLKPQDTANDAWLTKVIERTSRQAEGYCNRVFVQQTYTETFIGTSDVADPLRLNQAPVDASTFTMSQAEIQVDPATYSLDTISGLVYQTTSQMQWVLTTPLLVQYTGGFSDIPDDVQQAVMSLCVGENSARGRDPMLRAKDTPNLGREEFWVGSLPGGLGMPMDIAALLNPYRRGLVA